MKTIESIFDVGMFVIFKVASKRKFHLKFTFEMHTVPLRKEFLSCLFEEILVEEKLGISN